MGTEQVMTWLCNFRSFYVNSDNDVSMRKLATYCLVSYVTLYRWMNRKSRPNELKSMLIEDWLTKKDPKKCFATEASFKKVLRGCDGCQYDNLGYGFEFKNICIDGCHMESLYRPAKA